MQACLDLTAVSQLYLVIAKRESVKALLLKLTCWCAVSLSCSEPSVAPRRPLKYGAHRHGDGGGSRDGRHEPGTGKHGKVMGGGVVSRSSVLAVQMLRVPPHTWETLVGERKRNRSAVATKGGATGHGGDSGKLGDTGLLTPTAAPAYRPVGMKLRTPRPSFLQELQSWKKESLCVVTEAMEAAWDATFQSRAEGAEQLSLLQLGHVQVQGVPWGADVVCQFSCSSVALLRWDPVLTVVPLVPPRESQLLESSFVSCPLTEDDLWRFSNCHAPGFQLSPSRSEPSKLWTTLSPRISPPPPSCTVRAPWPRRRQRASQGTVLAYMVLQLMMEEDRWGMWRPEELVEEGQLLSKGQEEGEGGCFLMGLSTQVPFVAGFQARSQGGLNTPPVPSLPRGLFCTCLKESSVEMPVEVASILEPNYNQMEETGFSLPPEVLSWLQHEDAALTWSLVESCGLELGGPGHPVTRDPEVVLQLSALYASLAGLQLLAEPSPTALQTDA
ncbi:gasdermin-D-like [Bos indicus]|uniref:Gasdermin-D-like n=1 Tax=Bos indicus TaxID=9915 RepID=A0ABM4TGC9_BOSIN